MHKSPLFKGKTPLDLVKPRSCWSFYKLLCDDNSHLLQRIFNDIAFHFFLFLFAYSYILAFFVFCYLFLSAALALDFSNYVYTFIVALTIDLLLVAMIWVYLSGCIHKSTNNNCFAWISCLHE